MSRSIYWRMCPLNALSRHQQMRSCTVSYSQKFATLESRIACRSGLFENPISVSIHVGRIAPITSNNLYWGRLSGVLAFRSSSCLTFIHISMIYRQGWIIRVSRRSFVSCSSGGESCSTPRTNSKHPASSSCSRKPKRSFPWL
jgi:hypothetical protein